MDFKDQKPGIIFYLLQAIFAFVVFFAPFLIGYQFYLSFYTNSSLRPDNYIILSNLIIFVISAGMLKRKRWAWILNIIIGIIGIMLGLLGYIKQLSALAFISVVISLIITLLIYSQRRFYIRS